jgi:hypothetical protein
MLDSGLLRRRVSWAFPRSSTAKKSTRGSHVDFNPRRLFVSVIAYRKRGLERLRSEDSWRHLSAISTVAGNGPQEMSVEKTRINFILNLPCG